MKKIVAVTACVTGIAHTYLAEEVLKQAAKIRGIDIKVETKGAIGTENKLNNKDIEEASGVIIAADIQVDISRFSKKKVVITSTSKAISSPNSLFDEVFFNNEQN